MPRGARQKSESGIYHIVLQGHNRQEVFKDDEDKVKFLQTLRKFREKSNYKIYGYCLMGNHVHLLLHEREESMAKAVEEFIKFHAEQNGDRYLDVEDKTRLTDEEAKEMILKECGINDASELKGFEKEEKMASIRLLRNMGISTRQLARLTGISRAIILKA